MVAIGIEAILRVGYNGAVFEALLAVLIEDGPLQGIRKDIVGLGDRGKRLQSIVAVALASGQTLRVKS